jgi:hypothetical protein
MGVIDGTLRIVVMGYIVRGPVAGMAWHHLQYVMGLAALGHEVCFLEDSGEGIGCYDPSRGVTADDSSYGLQFAADCFDRVGLPDHWAYWDNHRGEWHGPCADSMSRFCSAADILIDLSPMDPVRPWVAEIPTRILIDTDPAFNQIDHLQNSNHKQRAGSFTRYFSFGENIGKPGCAVPDDGFPWAPTRQPIVLEAWPVTPGPAHGNFSTVMLWDSYGTREYDGRSYGMKSQSFGAYMDLPSRVGECFNIAMGGATAPRQRLLEHGWGLSDPLIVSRDLDTYRDFIRSSKGEFSVAKHGYIASHSGWFSERSAAYLASGRPVVVEDTGFGECLPSGAGLFSFQNADEAAAAVEKINRRYEYHQTAAREIAEECFDARKVLGSLLDRAMSRP